MTALWYILLGVPAALLALPALSDVTSVGRALLRRVPKQAVDCDGTGGVAARRRLRILVPAHDEGLLIRGCLRALAALRRGHVDVDVTVIADNCTDDTAAIARAEGFEVLERHDHERRGKPAAIAWAIAQVPLERYDAVSIVDADCLMEADFAERLLEGPDVRRVLTQPFIGVSNAGDSPITALAYLYSRLNNGLAFRLKAAAGINVPVGVGLTMGSELLARTGWTAFSLSEDWELYAQLTASGDRVLLAPRAVIWAQEAKGIAQGKSQRVRWQAGKFDVLQRYLPRILRNGGLSLHQRLDAAAELLSLGPIVNTMLAFAVAGLAWIAIGSSGWPLVVLALLGVLRVSIFAVAALGGAQNPGRIVMGFAYLPVYAAGRIVTFAWTLLRPPGSRWVRADRHAPAPEDPQT